MLEEKSDDELMLLVKVGSEPAFTQLFRRYTPLVFGMCMRFFSGNQARAEDVTQDVWCRVARYGKNYQPEGKFKYWLAQITRNTALSELSKKSWEHELLQDEEIQVSSSFNLEEHMMENQDEKIVKNAIDQLPDSQRAAMILWIDGARSYEQIATEMKVSVASVKSLLFRAKQSVVKALKVELHE